MAFADTLIAWYEDHKRDLPWRGEPDPYKIWVSEIILQQTRVQQGWDYYLRFIDNFPDVRTLAEADEERVLKVWQGLGYYSRARNMHAAAREIMSKHHGRFPDIYDEILSLKGIGAYTAAAIGSIAFHLPYPAVDGNVIRIVSRIFGVCEDVSQPAVVKRITEICETQMDSTQPGVFNQAAMDFGAMQCVPRNPNCEECPFQSDCYACQNNLVDILPVKKIGVDIFSGKQILVRDIHLTVPANHGLRLCAALVGKVDFKRKRQFQTNNVQNLSVVVLIERCRDSVSAGDERCPYRIASNHALPSLRECESDVARCCYWCVWR